MKQLTGTGTIPSPIEGYKLVVKSDGKLIAGILSFYKDSLFGDSWQNKLGDIVIDSLPVAKWQLFPILDSGVWISGEMPLPEAKEGTLLLLSVQFDSVTVAVARNYQWMAYDDEGQLSEINQLNYDITHWMWMSAPKNN